MHTVTVSTHLSASPDQVWSKIGDPGTISAWHPAIAKSSLEGKARKVTLANGAQIDEAIENIDDANRSYSYRIVESPAPFRNYVAVVELASLGADRCAIDWSCEFEIAPEAADRMREVVEGTYRGFIGALRKSLG